MSNVIKLGQDVLPGEPSADLIETVERLLEMAKSGHLRAIAYATVRENDVIGTGWDGVAGTRYSMGSAIMMLQGRYSEALLQSREPD
jgi:hypothetical protein